LAIDLSTQSSIIKGSYARYLRDLITGSLATGYGVACSHGAMVVLQRGRHGGDLSPQMARFLARVSTSVEVVGSLLRHLSHVVAKAEPLRWGRVLAVPSHDLPT